MVDILNAWVLADAILSVFHFLKSRFTATGRSIMAADKGEIQNIDDTLGTINVVPAGRLDADQYSAEDLDGVTESVFGSGNLAYASLQAAQTDGLVGEGGVASLTDLDLSGSPFSGDAQARENTLNTDRPLDTGDSVTTIDTAGDASFAGSTVGSVGASALSSDAAGFSSIKGLSLGSVNTSGDSFSSGGNVSNQQSEQSSSEVTINNQDVTNNITNEILPDGGEIGLGLDLDIIDTLGVGLTGVIEDSLELTLSINAVTENLTDIVYSLTGLNIPVLASPSIDGIINLLSTDDDPNDTDLVLEGTGLPEISLDVVEGIVGDIDLNIDLLNGLAVPELGELLNQDIELANPQQIIETLAAQNIEGTLDAVVNDIDIHHEIEASIQDALDGIEDIIGAPYEIPSAQEVLLTTNAIVEDVNDLLDEVVASGENILGDGSLLGGGDEGGEDADLLANVDLGVADQEVLDDLIGDVELDNPLEGVTNTVEDLVGDIDVVADAGLDVLGGVDDEAGEDDVSIGLDTDLVDTDILGSEIGVELDPVEEIVGDVDLDVDVATDVLGDAADALVDGADGGTGEDTIVSGVGDVLSDVGEAVVAAAEGTVVSPVVEALDGLPLFDGAEGSEDTDVVVDTDVDLVDHAVADVVADNPLEGVTNTVEDLVGDIDVVADAGLDVLGGVDDEAGEDDVSIGLDTDLVDTDILGSEIGVELDPVEEIVGDIDLDIDVATDVLGDAADALVDGADGGTGEDTIVSGVGDVLSDVGEAVVDPIVDVVGEPDIQVDLEAQVDVLVEDTDAFIENLENNIQDILAGSPDDLLDSVETISGEDISWTESTIEDGGGLFDDVINGIGGEADALPDPAATVGEGLGVLDVEPEVDIGALGGLF